MSLTRLPAAQGHDLLKLMLAKRAFARPLALSHAELAHLDDTQWRRQLLAPALLAGAMLTHLRKTWGPSHGQVPLAEGKQGQVFFFRCGDDVVMGLAAPLPRGTTWWWITDTPRDWPAVPYAFDHPAVSRFWPATADALTEAWLQAPDHAQDAMRLRLGVAQQILQHRALKADELTGT